MAVLNKYKKKALRKEPLYQAIMEDLFDLGVIEAAEINKLLEGVIGFIPRTSDSKPDEED